jgi:O-antigen/teichoic acid export membrane protein
MAVYGSGFTSGAGALAFLAFVPGVMTLAAVQSHALFAVDRGLRASVYGVLRALVTLAASIPLAVAYGPTGLGAGILLGASAQLALLTLELPHHLACRLSQLWPRHEMVALVVAGLAAYAASRAVSASSGEIAALILAPAAGLAVAAIAFVLLGGTQRRDRERIGRVVRRSRRERTVEARSAEAA